MAGPRIRNITPDEFRRMFASPETQSAGPSFNETISLIQALETKQKNEQDRQLKIREIEAKIEAEQAKRDKERQLAQGLTQPTTAKIQGLQEQQQAIPLQAQADIDPTQPGIEEGPLTAPAAEAVQAEQAALQEQIDPLEAEKQTIESLIGLNKIDEAIELAGRDEQAKGELKRSIELAKAKSRFRREEFKAKVAAENTKVDPKATQKQKAQGALTGIVAEVAQHYNTLRDMGGEVIDIEASTRQNLEARAKVFGPSQAVAGAVGGEAQSVRNKILNAQPLLINMIRQASEMGARGLDSEKELEFYLKAATDPTRDIQSNYAALARLDKAYGLGTFTAPAGTIKKLDQEFAQQNPQDAKAIQAKKWLEANPNHPKADKVREKLQSMGAL